MTVASFMRILKAFNRRKPFRPFFIEFSGDRILVSHPEVVRVDGEVVSIERM